MQQQEIVKFQMLSSEIEQASQFIGQIGEQKKEVENLLHALDELKAVKPNTPTRFPIANGIFAQGTISDTQNLFVNVGQGVLVPKTLEEAKELIAEQMHSLQEQEDLALRRQEELHKELEALEKTVSANM